MYRLARRGLTTPPCGASVLWRLRRAAMMENGLFDIQAEHLRDIGNPVTVFQHVDTNSAHEVMVPEARMKADATNVEFARCFLRLANLPNFALDRLSRYEATFGARPVGSYLRLMHWIGANLRSGGAAYVLAAPKNFRPSRANS